MTMFGQMKAKIEIQLTVFIQNGCGVKNLDTLHCDSGFHRNSLPGCKIINFIFETDDNFDDSDDDDGDDEATCPG